MAKVSSKVAVSLPLDLRDAVEKIRKKRGKSRSALVQEALRFWIRRQQELGLIRQYEEGYRRKPERKREVQAAEAAAVRLLAAEDW